jgi:hypothetical protein
LLQRAWHDIGAELDTLGLLNWTCEGDEEVLELTVSARVAFQAWQQSRMQRDPQCDHRRSTFHDLRGTAVKRFSEAGCTPQEVATITGHSLRDVSAIMDRYSSRTDKIAVAAIAKLERVDGEQDLQNGLQNGGCPWS